MAFPPHVSSYQFSRKHFVKVVHLERIAFSVEICYDKKQKRQGAIT